MHKFLIDECLSTTLVDVAQRAGHVADHVVHMGWQAYRDHSLMPLIEQGDYTFVTNNRLDFLHLHRGLELHNGLIILVPNVRRELQVFLFQLSLNHLAALPDLVNCVLEVDGNSGMYTITVRPLSPPMPSATE